jgi:alanine dehydrogenase
LRTGAATGVSTELLARPDSRVLACVGSGYQAWTQVEAVTRVRRIERVHVWSRTPENARDFARRLRADLGLTVETFDRSSDAVKDADVIVTITAAVTPVLMGADVSAGAHVVLAGSNHPRHREADGDLFTRAGAVYVDDLVQARSVSGDVRMAVAEGALDWADVRTLDSVLARTHSSPADPRDADGRTTVFCSQGIGSWDVALASMVHDQALDRGVGATLALDGNPGRECS